MGLTTLLYPKAGAKVLLFFELTKYLSKKMLFFSFFYKLCQIQRAKRLQKMEKNTSRQGQFEVSQKSRNNQAVYEFGFRCSILRKMNTSGEVPIFNII